MDRELCEIRVTGSEQDLPFGVAHDVGDVLGFWRDRRDALRFGRFPRKRLRIGERQNALSDLDERAVEHLVRLPPENQSCAGSAAEPESRDRRRKDHS